MTVMEIPCILYRFGKGRGVIVMADLIYRDSVVTWLKNMGHPKLAQAIADTERFQTQNVQEIKNGRWSISITTDLPPSGTHYKCSVCGKVAKVKRGSEIGLNYCGYCGAKMEVE